MTTKEKAKRVEAFILAQELRTLAGKVEKISREVRVDERRMLATTVKILTEHAEILESHRRG